MLKTQICVTRPLLCVNVQVSDEYVPTVLIVVLYIFILMFFFRSFDFISFELTVKHIVLLMNHLKTQLHIFH